MASWGASNKTFGNATDDIHSVNFSYDSQWLVVGTKNNYVFFYKRDCTPNPVNPDQHCQA